METVDAKKFEKKLGVKFNNVELLREACTHRSYINENRDCDWKHNERLEFLGDAVLELVITKYLFDKYPDRNEGELTSFRAALVNSITLADVSGKLGINDFLLLSKGEARDTGKARQYILANAFEAVVGAIYLDQGYDSANNFIAGSVFNLVDEIVEKGLWKDAKSSFQEMAQEMQGITPAYVVIDESGPDHDKEFSIGVYLNNELVAKGVGKSKQEAEQDAAQKGLEVKKWLDK